MRILHVTDAYLPKSGGIEVQVHDLASRQVEVGHTVDILTCAPEGLPPGSESDQESGDQTPGDQRSGCQGSGCQGSGDWTPVVSRVRPPWRRLRGTDTALRHRLRGTDGHPAPDVVHVHLSVLSPLGILAVRAASAESVPVVATLHSLWSYATPLYRAADLLTRWSHWRVQWTAVSELAASPLRSILRNRAEVTILPNGVVPSAWAVEPLERDTREVVVISVMRLAARKRPRALLRIVREAVDALPPGIQLRVVVVGDGPLHPRLERSVNRLGLTGTVDFLGRRGHAEIRELYRQADIYLAPAVLESFGIAALEARCAGVPVLARNHTGIADFISHGEHGLLADSDTDLAHALVTLATDPHLRLRLADNNRRCAPETGWADVLTRCELAYKNADTLRRPG